jgi:hypothetical protein
MMSESLEFFLCAIVIGVGATVVIDLWAMFLNRGFKIPSLNYGLLGRWIGHIPRGRFFHEKVAQANAVRGELAIGWIAHYVIGVVFAAVLLMIWGLQWAREPTLVPALIVGLTTIVAPWFLMQPAMGMGIASSKAPNPNAARFRSLMTHTVFGLGLYSSALLWAGLTPP